MNVEEITIQGPAHNPAYRPYSERKARAIARSVNAAGALDESSVIDVYDDLDRFALSRSVAMPPERIGHCFYYAILNLYSLLGLERPTIESMLELLPLEALPGLFPPAAAALLLGALEFPYRAGVVVTPPGRGIDETLYPYLSNGYVPMFSYQLVGDEIDEYTARVELEDPELAGIVLATHHAAVAYSWTDRWVKVLTGDARQPIQILPWKALPVSWHEADDMPSVTSYGFGLLRECVVVGPVPRFGPAQKHGWLRRLLSRPGSV
jgi:hypothetical protein